MKNLWISLTFSSFRGIMLQCSRPGGDRSGFFSRDGLHGVIEPVFLQILHRCLGFWEYTQARKGGMALWIF